MTPYYCPMCGLYATSEEQLRMHMLGEPHRSSACQGLACIARMMLRMHMLGDRLVALWGAN